MSVSVSGMNIKCIEATTDGRIFIAGGDGHLWEIFYQAEEGWFTSRTRKVCQTSGYGEYVLPNWGGSVESIEQIAIDNSRKLVYTLGSKSTIKTFHLDSPKTVSHVITYTFPSLLSHISILSANSPLLDPRNTSFVDITPIQSTESSRIYLVATTNSRVRLYLRAVRGYSFTSTSDQVINNMQVIHVRFPPDIQSGPMSIRSVQPCHFSKLFHPGLFFASHEPINPSDRDILFTSALDPGRIQMLSTVSQARMELIESATIVPIEGYVQDICPLTPTPTSWNELATQFEGVPREFAVLTNTGVHIIRRRRAVEVLSSLIRGTSGRSETEVRAFFEKYGRQEGCATSLAIACGQAPSGTQTPARQWHGRSSFGARVADDDVKDIARKCYMEFGGRAVCDEGRLLGREPTIDAVQLSGRWEGGVTYLSRLLRLIWKMPCFTMVTSIVQGVAVSKYLSNVPRERIVRILNDLSALSTFFEENKPFIEGLTGSEGLLRESTGLIHGGSRAEEVALQAEHRAMLSIVKFLEYAIQGIEFYLILDEDYSGQRQKLHDVVSRLPDEELRRDLLKMTFEDLFTMAKGREIVKEMVNVLVSLGVSGKTSVEAVTETLRVRCPAFCSGDDVIVYRVYLLMKMLI
jgi:nuclear pore complex protein Nup155